MTNFEIFKTKQVFTNGLSQFNFSSVCPFKNETLSRTVTWYHNGTVLELGTPGVRLIHTPTEATLKAEQPNFIVLLKSFILLIR